MTTKLVSTGVEFPDATIQLTAVPVTTTATSNLGLGTGAVDSITTGDYNVGVGDYALTSNTTGTENTAVGSNSLRLNTGSQNTACHPHPTRNSPLLSQARQVKGGSCARYSHAPSG